MTIPAPSFTDKGFIPPSEADDILPAVLADMNSAFGGGLNLALDTPQGQIASSEAAAIGNANDTFCELANGVDPAYAAGRMQDAIGRIYFIERNPALPTVVPATCIGAFGTVIPAGAQAVAEDGNIYLCMDGGTIPVTGTIDLNFQCSVPGPITCPVGSLNRIYTVISGWDTIDNSSEGTLGRNTESRAEFETRRALSVAHNSVGSLPSIWGAVLLVPGVLDAFVTENDANSPQTIGGLTIAAHSLYVAAVGGTDDDVARAIWSKKAPGCGYTGNTTVVVQDTNSSFSPPYPSYSVSFQRPDSLPILFSVMIANNSNVPADAAAQIQAAIIGAFGGVDGGTRASIGSIIYASRYYAPIALLGNWAQIINVKVGCQNDASAEFTGDIVGTALTISALTSGSIGIGQTIVGAGVLDGTKIVSGAGSSWIVNQDYDVASTTMFGCLADLDDVSSNIDQVPTISAANISVTLS